MLMNMASALPDGMFNSWNKLNKFIGTNVAPGLSWSAGIVASVSGVFQTGPSNNDSGQTSPGERYGTSEELGKAIENLRTKYYFAEDTTAANEEARLCLKKGGSGTWGVCESLETYVQNLVKQEEQRRRSELAQPKLRVQVYFASSDIMIGKKGQEYFEQSWKKDEVIERMHFESKELPGTDHDSALLDLKKGALESVFEDVRNAN